MICTIGQEHSIANQFLFELRDVSIQHDSMRFRRNLQRLGNIMAYEISQKLSYSEKMCTTPLGGTALTLPHQPVLVSVLRAGLPYFQGFVDFFDQSPCGFIGAYRKEGEGEISIRLEYLASPSLDDVELILIDPMLATGKSFVQCIESLQRHGTPRHIHVAALVAAPEGISFLKSKVRIPLTIWSFAVDEKLDKRYYIVPGLGDAGDLAFGEKL
jgi:uracil phosphoribosyltransferase